MKTIFMTALFMILSASAFAGSVTVKATDSDMLKSAANVDYVQYLKGQDTDVKIFSVSGGDPAMNGAYLNVAVFVDVETGWNVFQLANVRNYKLLPSAKKGYLKIKLVRDNFNRNGDIVQENVMLFVNLTKAQDGEIQTEEVLLK
jgi:hypothetical protein